MTQIFELAMLHGVRLMGVASTEDHRVKVAFLEAPAPRMYGDTEVPGQLTPRQLIALGHMLTELGTAMLSGELKHDANKGGM